MGETLLHTAIRNLENGGKTKIIKLFIKTDVNINAQNIYGKIALHLIAYL